MQREPARRGPQRLAGGYRDLTDPELWERSLDRSRKRRAAADARGPELPARQLSAAALVALAGGPVAGVAVAKALDDGGQGGASAPAAKPAASSEAPPATKAARTADRAQPGAYAQLLDGTARTAAVAVPPAARSALVPPKPKPAPRSRRAHSRTTGRAPARPAAATTKRSRGRGSETGRRARTAVRRGGGVRALQSALGLPADGAFGAATERALKRWQRRHGLTPDGVAGPETRAKLGLGRGPTLKRKRSGRRRGGSGGGRSRGGAGGGVVARVIAAANRIAGKPYRYGGGHGSFEDSGYDCSGSVSYALHGGGLLSTPLDSSGFMSYGRPGPGRHITIYANPGHVYMVINGRRFDTSARRQTGSRWSGTGRSGGGYTVRHPPGL